MVTFFMTPGEQIKKLRNLSGLTQAQVAKIIGIKRVSYTQKENGRSPFTINEVLLILKGLQKKIEKKEFSFWLNEFIGVEDQALTEFIKNKDPDKDILLQRPFYKKTENGDILDPNHPDSVGALLQDNLASLVDLLEKNERLLSAKQKKKIDDVLSKIDHILIPTGSFWDQLKESAPFHVEEENEYETPTHIDPLAEIINEVIQERRAKGRQHSREDAQKWARILKKIITADENGDLENLLPLIDRHRNIVPEFDDQDEGFETNKNLLIIEKHDNDLFYELTSLIRGKAKPIIKRLKNQEGRQAANGSEGG